MRVCWFSGMGYLNFQFSGMGDLVEAHDDGSC